MPSDARTYTYIHTHRKPITDNMDLRARAGRGPLTAAGVEELEEPAGGSRGGAAQRRGKKLNKRGKRAAGGPVQASSLGMVEAFCGRVWNGG